MPTPNHKVKVAFCIPDMIVGGVDTVFVNTIDELSKNKDLDIVIITHARVREPLYTTWLHSHPEIPVYVYYPLCNWFEDLTPKCRGILKPLRKMIFSMYKKYRRLIYTHKFKDVDVFIDYKNFEFFKELRYFNKPKIAWAHSAISYFEHNGSLSRLPMYDIIVGITDDFVDDFKSKYPEYTAKVIRIYNPMNVNAIRQKAKLEKTPREKYFCHVSRLVKGKDIKTLMDAFDIFAKSHGDVKLYIVGDGDMANDFKSYAKTLKSNNQIIFTGEKHNPYGIMRGAIANVLSSEFEGLPTVVLESVILGVPCISSKCKNGPREILLDGKGGFLFDVGDVKMLAKHMNFVYENPEKANELANVAMDGLNRFSPSTISKQIYDLIKKFSVNL